MLAPKSGAIEDVQRELAEYRRTGSQLGVTVLCVIVGQALVMRGRFKPLLDVVAEAVATMERTSERFLEAELYRLKARALLAQDETGAQSQALSALAEALAVARRQNARTLEHTCRAIFPACRGTRADLPKLANCLLRFTAGSPKASTRST